MKIAQKTLVGKRWKRGLNLIDLETKSWHKNKNVNKYMERQWDYGWREFLKKYVDEVGGMGEYGWYMGFKQSMTVGIPEIYREVLEAWRSILPKIDYECKEVETL